MGNAHAGEAASGQHLMKAEGPARVFLPKCGCTYIIPNRSRGRKELRPHQHSGWQRLGVGERRERERDRERREEGEKGRERGEKERERDREEREKRSHSAL